MKRTTVRVYWAGLLLAGIMAGCSTTPPSDVTTYFDDVSGLRTDLLSDNLLESGPQPRELVWLNASRVYHSHSRHSYYLEVSYMAREDVGLLGIAPGQSLTLTVDGEPIRLTGTGSETEGKAKDGVVNERAIYKVNKLVLQKISVAQKVKVSVQGKSGLIEREFNADNFDKVRRFVTRYAL